MGLGAPRRSQKPENGNFSATIPERRGTTRREMQAMALTDQEKALAQTATYFGMGWGTKDEGL